CPQHDLHSFPTRRSSDLEFWASIAQHFTWKRKWDKVLNWNFTDPQIEWFKGAKLNITENCLDRWALTQPNTPAIIWESNDPEERSEEHTSELQSRENLVC